jgi:hypothetical protein
MCDVHAALAPGRGRARHPQVESLPHPGGALPQPQAAFTLRFNLIAGLYNYELGLG